MKWMLVMLLLPLLWLSVHVGPSMAQPTVIRATSAPSAFNIRRTGTQPSARKDHALFIANGEYDDARFRKLPNCSFDVDELKKLLETKFSFTTEVRKNMMYSDFESKLFEYASRTWNEDDQLLIYIAGHGGFRESIHQGFLVMKDTDKVKQNQCFSLAYLKSILENLSCKHILVVLDVCYGGTFDEAIALEGEPMRGDPVSSPTLDESRRDEYVLKKLKPKTRIYVASGGKEPVAEGQQGEHSPFAKELLAKLTETAAGNDKLLTVYELKTSLEKKVPTVFMGTFDGNQSNSDFLFIAK